MIFLYLLNLVAYPIILVLSPLYFTRYFRLNSINPLTVVMVVSLPTTLVTSLVGPAVILEEGLFDPYFQYALLVSNVHDLLGVLVLILFVRAFSEKKKLSRWIQQIAEAGSPARPDRMRSAALLFLGLYFVFFVLLAQHSFGVLEWIESPRAGYQFHREGAGQWYAAAITSLSISFVLATIYARSSLQVVLITSLCLMLVYLLGSKGLIVLFGVYSIVILAIQEYRYLKPVTILVGGTALLLVISNFAAAFGTLDLQNLANYTDGFLNASRYYQRYLEGALPLYHGTVFFSQLWGLVPRALYPDKPYVYGVITVSDIFYPGSAEQTNTPAFATIIYFADFGWLGVILFALLNPSTIFTAFLYVVLLPRLRMLNILNGSTHTRTITYAALLLIAPSFLMFFDFPNNMILFFAVAGVIDVVNRLRVLAPAKTSEKVG